MNCKFCGKESKGYVDISRDISIPACKECRRKVISKTHSIYHCMGCSHFWLMKFSLTGDAVVNVLSCYACKSKETPRKGGQCNE